VNDSADPGGATNFGVMLATYQYFECNSELSVDEGPDRYTDTRSVSQGRGPQPNSTRLIAVTNADSSHLSANS
jgi:hypothetical protein